MEFESFYSSAENFFLSVLWRNESTSAYSFCNISKFVEPSCSAPETCWKMFDIPHVAKTVRVISCVKLLSNHCPLLWTHSQHLLNSGSGHVLCSGRSVHSREAARMQTETSAGAESCLRSATVTAFVWSVFVQVSNGSFTWGNNQLTLSDINIRIPTGRTAFSQDYR